MPDMFMIKNSAKATKQLTGRFNQYQPKYVVGPISPGLATIYYN